MGLLRKFQQILPKSFLLTIYKTFIRSRLNYADIIYDQAYDSAFHDKLESIQYNACLALTGAIRGTSTEKIYQELTAGQIPTKNAQLRPDLILAIRS